MQACISLLWARHIKVAIMQSWENHVRTDPDSSERGDGDGD